MELTRIERYVSDLMTVSGVEKEGKEQNVGLALYHLLMSAALRDLMSDGEKELFRLLTKKLQYFFCTRLSLKERKETKKKKNFPPNPLIKEKDKKETEEKTTHTVCDADSGFDEELLNRLRAFEGKCEKYVKKYGRNMIDNFVRYWTLPNQVTGKMRFEEERYWRLSSKLESWQQNSNTIADEAAALRKQRQEKQLGKNATDAEQQRIAQERTDANDRLEQEIAERKKNAVSYEEWLASKEKNNDNQDN